MKCSVMCVEMFSGGVRKYLTITFMPSKNNFYKKLTVNFFKCLMLKARVFIKGFFNAIVLKIKPTDDA